MEELPTTFVASNGPDAVGVEAALDPVGDDGIAAKRCPGIPRRRSRSMWTVGAALCTLALVCAGVAFMVVSLTTTTSASNNNSAASMDEDSTTEVFKTAQDVWVHLTRGGNDGTGSLLPDSVSEALLLYPNNSPQAKAVRWLALNGSSNSTSTNLPLIERYALVVFYYHWAGNLWTVPAGEWISNTMHASDAMVAEDGSPQKNGTKKDGDNEEEEDYGEQKVSASAVVNECSWSGITCNEDQSSVISVDMTDQTIFSMLSLAGTELPPELGLLTNLEHLLLPGHGLQGPAASLKNLTRLVEIDLSNNQLTSVLPHITNLINLEVVKLGNNRLQDVIQSRDHLRKLRQVRVWDVQQNPELTCTAQYNFMKYTALYWRSLKHIDLSSTNIYTVLPDHILFMVWPNITTLQASNTPLEGTLPYHIRECTHLRQIRLSDPTSDSTGLTGTLPPAMGELTQLEHLALGGNAFESTIPTFFGELRNLKELYLDKNSGIVGTLPSEFGLLTSLEILHLSDTRLSGHIPTELGLLTNLQSADLQIAYFSGSMPSEVCALPSIESLRADCAVTMDSTEKPLARVIQCDCCTECYWFA